MFRILLLNKEGLQLNFDEVKPKEKNRNSLPIETLKLKTGTSKSFDLNYPLKNHVSDLQDHVPLFIQAQIVLSIYNENQIKYGIVRANRVELKI